MAQGEAGRIALKTGRIGASAAALLLALTLLACASPPTLSTVPPALHDPSPAAPTPRQFALPSSETSVPLMPTALEPSAIPAPFILPTSGYLGLKRGNAYGPGNTRHTGIDIWASLSNGRVWTDAQNERGNPVYAVHDGWLGLAGSGVQVCHPPLDDERWPYLPAYRICSYYGHLKGIPRAFWQAYCPDSAAAVRQGDLLGYMDYDSEGDSVHLHFSVVMQGKDGCALDERRYGYTVTPFPYFGLDAAKYHWLDEFP